MVGLAKRKDVVMSWKLVGRWGGRKKRLGCGVKNDVMLFRKVAFKL